jgi:endo-1,4-beta-xylanase
VPDPRVTNPELFDLRNPDAPIPQFVNALKNAGIEVSAEQIAQGITFVSTKEDGTPLVDKDGNPYVVAVYNLDPSLFPEKYRDLAEPIPLMIAEKGENGEWRWKNIIESLRVFADSKNFPFGSQIVYYKLNDSRYTKLAAGNFNFFTSSGEILEESLWKTNSPNEYRFDYSRADEIVNFARRNNATTLWLHLFDTDLPEWVRTLNEDEFINLMRLRVHDTLQHLRSLYPDGEIIYSVFNENFDWTTPRMPIKYVEEAFRQAREADPEAILLYNDVNDFVDGTIDDHDRAVMNLVSRIKQQGNLDGVGLQMHLNANNIPSPEIFRELIRTYKKLGVRVYITEFDIDFGDFHGSIQDKQRLKAEVYRNMLRVAMEKEVDGFAMFGFSGVAAWHPDGLIFDEGSRPTAAFYSVASVMLSQMTK